MGHDFISGVSASKLLRNFFFFCTTLLWQCLFSGTSIIIPIGFCIQINVRILIYFEGRLFCCLDGRDELHRRPRKALWNDEFESQRLHWRILIFKHREISFPDFLLWKGTIRRDNTGLSLGSSNEPASLTLRSPWHYITASNMNSKEFLCLATVTPHYIFATRDIFLTSSLYSPSI